MLDKPQVNIFAICDRVIRAQNGKPSLLGVFDAINLPTFPAAFSFVLFTQIMAPRGEYRVTIHMCVEEGMPQKLFEGSIQIPEDNGVAYLEANLNLPFTQPGLFEFRLYINDTPRLTRPFYVRQVTTPL